MMYLVTRTARSTYHKGENVMQLSKCIFTIALFLPTLFTFSAMGSPRSELCREITRDLTVLDRSFNQVNSAASAMLNEIWPEIYDAMSSPGWWVASEATRTAAFEDSIGAWNLSRLVSRSVAVDNKAIMDLPRSAGSISEQANRGVRTLYKQLIPSFHIIEDVVKDFEKFNSKYFNFTGDLDDIKKLILDHLFSSEVVESAPEALTPVKLFYVWQIGRFIDKFPPEAGKAELLQKFNQFVKDIHVQKEYQKLKNLNSDQVMKQLANDL